MEFKILYWHWIAFGMVLMGLELIMPSFTIFWFALGAILVGLLLLIGIEPAFSVQILIWTIASVLFTFAWFKWIKPLSLVLSSPISIASNKVSAVSPPMKPP